jgi:hypothetical protein
LVRVNKVMFLYDGVAAALDYGEPDLAGVLKEHNGAIVVE